MQPWDHMAESDPPDSWTLLLIFGFASLAVSAVLVLHWVLYKRAARQHKQVSLQFIPTHDHERPRFFTQRGMRTSWSSWATLIALSLFVAGCVCQVFITIFITSSHWRDGVQSAAGVSHKRWVMFLQTAARLALFFLGGIVMIAWWSTRRSESLRVHWMMPASIDHAELKYVLVTEVTDFHEEQKLKRKSSKRGGSSGRSSKRSFLYRPVDQALKCQMLLVENCPREVDFRYIHFGGIRYPWNEASRRFEPRPPEVQDFSNLGALSRTGLSQAEVEKRLAGVGPNEVLLSSSGARIGFSMYNILARTLLSPFFMLPVLGLFGALMNQLRGHREMPGVIRAAIYIACVVVIWTAVEFWMAKETRKMWERQRLQRVKALRGESCWSQIDARELVPGDVIILQEGDVIPADCVLIEGSATVDESALTGEPIPVAKSAGNSSDPNEMLNRVVRSATLPADSWAENTGRAEGGGSSSSSRRRAKKLQRAKSACEGAGTAERQQKLIRGRARALFNCDSGVQAAARLSAGSVISSVEVSAVCKAWVVRTGGWSSQGALLRAALFARTVGWVGERTQIRLLVFAFIALYCLSMVSRIGLVCFYETESQNFSIFTAFDRFVQIVDPMGDLARLFKPEWPLGLAIVALLAQRRLKKHGVKGTDLDANSTAGALTTVVFDKTGTITSKFLQLQGVHPFVRYNPNPRKSSFRVDPMVKTASNPEWTTQLPLDLQAAIQECVLLENKHRSSQQQRSQQRARMFGSQGGGAARLVSVNGVPVSNPSDDVDNDGNFDHFNVGSSSNNNPGDWSASTARTEYWQDETAPLLNHQGFMASDNPVDAELFRAANAMDETHSDAVAHSHPHWRSTKIIRRFSFDHTFQTSGVVSSDVHTGKRWVVCKGAFRRMARIAEDVPKMYHEVAERHARSGKYVLAIGFRELKERETVTDRCTIERKLKLLGLLVFDNPMKKDSPGALKEIANAGVRPVICTGDNEIAGAAVARTLGLLPDRALLASRANDNNDREGGAIEWQLICGKAQRWSDSADSNRGSDNGSSSRLDGVPVSSTDVTGRHAKTSLVLTGAALRGLYKNGKLGALLPRVRVVASATARDKLLLVRALQEEKEVVGMVGDGWNDAGALRQAHVGVILRVSNVANVCAFSTNEDSLAAVPELLKICRNCTSTSINVANYCVAIGLVAAMNSAIFYLIDWMFSPDYYYAVTNWATAFCDHLIVPFAFIALCWRAPRKTLWIQPPSGRFISVGRAFSLMGMVLLVSSLYFLNMVFLRTWDEYVITPGKSAWFQALKDTYHIGKQSYNKVESSFRFLQRHHAYAATARQIRSPLDIVLCLLILTADNRWGRSMLRSWLAVGVFAFSATLWCVLVLTSDNWLTCQFGVNCSNKWMYHHMNECFYGPQLETFAMEHATEMSKTEPPVPENECQLNIFNGDLANGGYPELHNHWPFYTRMLALTSMLLVASCGYVLSNNWHKLKPKKKQPRSGDLRKSGTDSDFGDCYPDDSSKFTINGYGQHHNATSSSSMNPASYKNFGNKFWRLEINIGTPDRLLRGASSSSVDSPHWHLPSSHSAQDTLSPLPLERNGHDRGGTPPMRYDSCAGLGNLSPIIERRTPLMSELDRFSRGSSRSSSPEGASVSASAKRDGPLERLRSNQRGGSSQSLQTQNLGKRGRGKFARDENIL